MADQHARDMHGDWTEHEPQTDGFPTRRDIEVLALRDSIVYHALKAMRRGHVNTWEEAMRYAVVLLVKQNDKLRDMLSRTVSPRWEIPPDSERDFRG